MRPWGQFITQLFDSFCFNTTGKIIIPVPKVYQINVVILVMFKIGKCRVCPPGVSLFNNSPGIKTVTSCPVLFAGFASSEVLHRDCHLLLETESRSSPD